MTAKDLDLMCGGIDPFGAFERIYEVCKSNPELADALDRMDYAMQELRFLRALRDEMAG